MRIGRAFLSVAVLVAVTFGSTGCSHDDDDHHDRDQSRYRNRSDNDNNDGRGPHGRHDTN